VEHRAELDRSEDFLAAERHAQQGHVDARAPLRTVDGRFGPLMYRGRQDDGLHRALHRNAPAHSAVEVDVLAAQPGKLGTRQRADEAIAGGVGAGSFVVAVHHAIFAPHRQDIDIDADAEPTIQSVLIFNEDVARGEDPASLGHTILPQIGVSILRRHALNGFLHILGRPIVDIVVVEQLVKKRVANTEPELMRMSRTLFRRLSKAAKRQEEEKI